MKKCIKLQPKKKQTIKLLLSITLVCFLSGCTDVSQIPSVEPVSEVQAETDNFSKSSKIQEISPYFGSDYVILKGNIPDFTDEQKSSLQAIELYSDLDSLGRCGVAFANICQEIMPVGERGNIGMIRPSGWQISKYNHIDGGYLFNRCHLIGWQLAGENDNEKNLITGTRYLNATIMLPFEKMIADYVKTEDNHVLYRVTPVFEGDNLVAAGLQLEAWSVEDRGKGVCFNVFCYNIQPGIAIDYATGDNSPTEGKTVEADWLYADENAHLYILNTNTKKFHNPGCDSVNQITEQNKNNFIGSGDELINTGYSPCGNCRP